ncbi:MAG TPA: ZIP family metal transporter, partial [Actinomycetota bacterium]|nr:ZIP family metal transporter [Actinomycetota bacterium]
MSLVEVVLIAAGTAAATGLGAVPLLFYREGMKRSTVAIASAVAAGSMTGASIGLLYEGARVNGVRTAVGVVVGAAFVLLSNRFFGEHEDLHFGVLKGAGARRAIVIIAIMTVHSITEGVGVGVSFADGEKIGLVIAIAIAIHNIPEGLAISLTLVPNGYSVTTAALWSVASSLPQPIMAIPAFLGVRVVTSLLPVGLGFAGGAMLWLALGYMLPQSLHET